MMCKLAIGDIQAVGVSPSGKVIGDWTGMGIHGTGNFDFLHWESRKSIIKTLNLILLLHPWCLLYSLTLRTGHISR